MKPQAWVATLIAPASAILSPHDIDGFVTLLAQQGAQIDSCRLIEHGKAADIVYSGGPIIKTTSKNFDVLAQPAARRRKKILIADMESTIIEQEMLDELATEIGIGDKVAEITRRAMNGELDFETALRARVGLLAGQPETLLAKVAERMTLMPGARELVAAMKQAGAKCWLVSGGFTFFVKIIADRLGFDRFYANQLGVTGGVISGDIVPPILDKMSKKTLMEMACTEYGCDLADVLAVGDGANDVPMLQTCAAAGGLGVGYRAKPKVRELIHNQINHCDLSALIYAQSLMP